MAAGYCALGHEEAAPPAELEASPIEFLERSYPFVSQAFYDNQRNGKTNDSNRTDRHNVI
jgi:hypothetical protein